MESSAYGKQILSFYLLVLPHLVAAVLAEDLIPWALIACTNI